MQRTGTGHRLGMGQSCLYPYRTDHLLAHLYLYSSLLLDLVFAIAEILGLFFSPTRGHGLIEGSSGGDQVDYQKYRDRVASWASALSVGPGRDSRWRDAQSCADALRDSKVAIRNEAPCWADPLPSILHFCVDGKDREFHCSTKGD